MKTNHVQSNPNKDSVANNVQNGSFSSSPVTSDQGTSEVKLLCIDAEDQTKTSDKESPEYGKGDLLEGLRQKDK